jgi:hypothetical protein
MYIRCAPTTQSCENPDAQPEAQFCGLGRLDGELKVSFCGMGTSTAATSYGTWMIDEEHQQVTQ